MTHNGSTHSNHGCKCRRVAQAVFAAGVAATILSGHAQSATVELGARPGGYVYLHIAQAKHWLATGKHVVIRDAQSSAAAIQVIYFKAHGGSICYAPTRSNGAPALYLHQSEWRGTYQNDFARYVGPRNAAKLKGLQPVKLSRFEPSDFGIGRCRASASNGP